MVCILQIRSNLVTIVPTLSTNLTHILFVIIGCKTPGRKDKLFNCGAMTAKQEDLNSALSPCGSGSHVIYAWALNAPELMLPEGVGFRVGGPDSDIDWLVLQVHYASISRIPEEGKMTII